MPLILETSKFIVAGHDQPHHDRNNGGHAKVTPREMYADRIDMETDLYLAMMQLVRITGEAIMNVMRKEIDIVRINYQDNGNWAERLGKEQQIHEHLYVRSRNEKHPENDERFRGYPDALVFPFIGDNPEYYRSFQPYTEEDCANIREEIERLLATEKYQGVKEQL